MDRFVGADDHFRGGTPEVPSAARNELFGPSAPTAPNAAPAVRVHAASASAKARDAALSGAALARAIDDCAPQIAWAPMREVLADGLSPDALSAKSDEELVAWVACLESLGSLVDAARVFAAGAVSERCATAHDGPHALDARTGCRSDVEVLERLTGQSRATVRQRLTMSRAVTSTGEAMAAQAPIVATALAAGALNSDAAQAIATLLTGLSRRGANPDDVTAAEIGLVAAATGRSEAELAALVASGALDPQPSPDPAGVGTTPATAFLSLSSSDQPPFTFSQIRKAASAWELAIDPDGALADDSTARRRGVTLGKVRDGLIPLRGNLLPEVATQLTRLFDAYLNPRRSERDQALAEPGEEGALPGVSKPDTGNDSDSEHAATVAGSQVSSAKDPRSWDQKRHDALAGILTSAAASPDAPLIGGTPPVLVVTVDADQLPAVGAGTATGLAFLQGHHGATGHHGALSAASAIHIGCTGAIQRVITGSAGQILSLSSPHRVFTVHQRRAIIARDGGCVIPGCTVPASWCEIHHVQPWADGGPTHTDNGVLLCWYHHRNLDTIGWEITMCGGVPRVRAKPVALRPYQPFLPKRIVPLPDRESVARAPDPGPGAAAGDGGGIHTDNTEQTSVASLRHLRKRLTTVRHRPPGQAPTGSVSRSPGGSGSRPPGGSVSRPQGGEAGPPQQRGPIRPKSSTAVKQAAPADPGPRSNTPFAQHNPPRRC